jgi:hypothetical protein
VLALSLYRDRDTDRERLSIHRIVSTSSSNRREADLTRTSPSSDRETAIPCASREDEIGKEKGEKVSEKSTREVKKEPHQYDASLFPSENACEASRGATEG